VGNTVSPQARREALQPMRANTGISERRACSLMELSRTVLRYEGRGERDCGVLRSRILLLAAQRRRFGYRRIHALIRREGLAVNCKRLQRIYCEERLQATRRARRRGLAVERRAIEVPQAPNDVWSINFLSDSLG
jgi:putative transposase